MLKLFSAEQQPTTTTGDPNLLPNMGIWGRDPNFGSITEWTTGTGQRIPTKCEMFFGTPKRKENGGPTLYHGILGTMQPDLIENTPPRMQRYDNMAAIVGLFLHE
ncbi:hypothetical protein Bbelb_124450 [Branchiostoma belcheri]|nr:hypothetical protein Bbelb_124450 [Branchiostoma belcheri]